MKREKAIRFLIEQPYKIGHMVGFTDLTEMHNNWIRDMVISRSDRTLQAHRGSYKTTCVSIALAILIIIKPREKIAFFRKTDGDVREVIRQTEKILSTPQVGYLIQCIYDLDLKFTELSGTAISTNLSTGVHGASQLIGMGISSSVTGKHYDIIFTDDIVNVKDRISRAEREKTKTFYRELQNIKNRTGRIYNTGTPWHKEDCFSIMPEPEKYDYKRTGMMTNTEISEIKSKMTPSLFSANYELRHIAEDDIIFDNPVTDSDPANIEQGVCHIDAAYHGDDYTAFSIAKRQGKIIYVFGKIWRKHIDDVEDQIIEYIEAYNAGKVYCEDNGDKGYLAKSLRKKGMRAVTYHEAMNKHIKIVTFLKQAWTNIEFVKGTDQNYINQICDYTENAEHDDAPDSLASIIRALPKYRSKEELEKYMM